MEDFDDEDCEETDEESEFREEKTSGRIAMMIVDALWQRSRSILQTQ